LQPRAAVVAAPQFHDVLAQAAQLAAEFIRHLTLA
jgi:hypothetical protein